MYRSLLVPLDGSAFAEHALPLALGLARRAGAAVNVAQVRVPFTMMFTDSLMPGIYESEARVLEQERAYLDGIVQRVRSLAPVAVTCALLEGTAPRGTEVGLTSAARAA